MAEGVGFGDVEHVRRLVRGAEVLPEGGEWLVFGLQVDWHVLHFFFGKFLLFDFDIGVVLGSFAVLYSPPMHSLISLAFGRSLSPGDLVGGALEMLSFWEGLFLFFMDDGGV